MVLSINSNFLRVTRAGSSRPVYLAIVKVGAGSVEGTDQFTFATEPGLGYPASLDDVGQIALSLDIVTRVVADGRHTITFRRDSAIKRLIKSHRIKNKGIIIKLGFSDIAIADYITLASLVIQDAVPDATQVQFECVTGSGLLRDTELANFEWTNMHPYPMMLEILDRSNIPAAFYNAADFAYDVDLTISHWNLSRCTRINNGSTPPTLAMARETLEPTRARDLLTDLARITSVSFVPDENGIIRPQRYNFLGGSSRVIKRRDVFEFKQLSTWDNLINEVIVRFAKTLANELMYSEKDETSQTTYQYPGEPRHIVSETIDTEWLNAVGPMLDPQPTAAPPDNGFLYNVAGVTSTSFIVEGGGLYGFSGARTPGLNGPGGVHAIPANAQLGGSRNAFLMFFGVDARVESSQFVNDRPEIVQCNACVLETLPPYPPEVQAPNDKWYPVCVRYTLNAGATNGGRAQFENPVDIPDAWNLGKTFLVDVTIPVDLVQRALRRFAHGVAGFEIRTTLAHIDLQIGDFVTGEDDLYLDYGLEGLDTGTILEIVGKEVRARDSTPGIVFTLAKVRDAGTLAIDNIFQPGISGPPPGVVLDPLGDYIVTTLGEFVVSTGGEWLIRS